MSVAKVIELTSASPASIEDAIVQGVAKASDTLERVEGVWVQEIKAVVQDGKISEWRVNLKLTFVLK
jgi:dodecin